MENKPQGKKSFINPYQLLNVKPSSSLKELKSAYRNLALICHPDKNGSREDMIMIQNAYEYVKKEIEFGKNNISFEEAEEQFKEFCDKQTAVEEKPYPDLMDIIHDQREYLKKFNQAFDEIRSKENQEDIMPMTYQSNYGDSMVNDGDRDDLDKPLEETQKFKRDLIIYEEPTAAFINGLSAEFDFKMTVCKDFTNYNTSGGDAFGADYQMAFAEVDDISKIAEEILKEKKEEMDKLMNMYNDPEIKEQINSSKQVSLEYNQMETDEEINQKADMAKKIEDLKKQRAEIDNMFADLSVDEEQTPLDKILNLRKEKELEKMTGETPSADDLLFIEKEI